MPETISWDRPAEISPELYSSAVRDILKVLDRHPVPLVGPTCRGPAIIDPDGVIAFDGEPPFAADSFHFDRVADTYAYCKTNELPYDFAVKCTLLVFKHYLGDQLKIGDEPVHTWASWWPAERACRNVLGYPKFHFPTLLDAEVWMNLPPQKKRGRIL